MHEPFHGRLRTLDHVWCARSHSKRDLFVDECAPIDVADLLVSIKQKRLLHEIWSEVFDIFSLITAASFDNLPIVSWLFEASPNAECKHLLGRGRVCRVLAWVHLSHRARHHHSGISTYAHGGSLGPNLLDFLRLQLIERSHFARHCFNLQGLPIKLHNINY